MCFKALFAGLMLQGSLRFKIDWASFIVGRKFTIFALFSLVFESNFPSTSPRGAYTCIWRVDLTEGFLRYQLEWLIFGILRYEVMAKDQFHQHRIERSLTSPENTADEN